MNEMTREERAAHDLQERAEAAGITCWVRQRHNGERGWFVVDAKYRRVLPPGWGGYSSWVLMDLWYDLEGRN